jgi:crotonobetainyl-CoA:carnitine CoA-transferase CaiB-like acyl-CoA transferase
MVAGPRTDLPSHDLLSSGRPPLAGISVVEHGEGPASSIAGMLLSDAGASVVKLEPPGGASERLSAAHRVWNRGKQSFVLDTDLAVPSHALHALLRNADVVLVQAPAARIEEFIAMLDTSAIVCRITGFGSNGPLSALDADDTAVAAYAGLCADQAGWLPGPSSLAHLLPSTAAAILTVQRVVAALIERTRSEAGAVMETSLLASLFAMSGQVRGERVPQPRPLSASPRGSSPFYSLFECQDGAWLQLGCLHAGFVQKAIDALGLRTALQPLIDDARFGDGVTIASDAIAAPLLAAMDETFSRAPRAEWLTRLAEGDVPAAPVLPGKDFLNDPQAIFNGLAVVQDDEVGAITEVGPFARLSRSGDGIRVGAPRLGVHKPVASGSRQSERTRAESVAASLELAGLVVLELSNIIAGPMVGRCLAELGANVIKLESPDGDIFRQQLAPEFLPLNAGKRSICLNLKDPEGNACGRRMAGLVDVVVNNMRPGVAERLGLGWDSVRALNPAAVYCQVTAFGAGGPYSARPGGDPLAGALTGMQYEQGLPVGKPVYVRGAPIDNIAGMLGAMGILLALRERQRSGMGQLVETSLLDAGALLNCHSTMSGPNSVADARPASQYGLNALRRLYEAADGWLSLDVDGQDEWRILCNQLNVAPLLSDARFCTPERRLANDTALTQVLAAAIANLAVDAVCGSLRKSGLLSVPVRPQTGDLDDPQALTNGWVETFEHPTLGSIRVFRAWHDGTRQVHLRPPPLLGQHGIEILRELDFNELDIDALTQTGALCTPTPRDGVM